MRKSLGRQDLLCTLQSSHSPMSWQLHFLLIYRFHSMPFFALSSLLSCTPVKYQRDRAHFSPLRGWMKIKKRGKMKHGRHHLLWFMMAAGLAAACLLGWLPARRLLPKRSNGELRSARSDTVEASGMADYGAKYWSLPHMCQNSPRPLIRISPPRHTGTNRIY